MVSQGKSNSFKNRHLERIPVERGVVNSSKQKALLFSKMRPSTEWNAYSDGLGD